MKSLRFEITRHIKVITTIKKKIPVRFTFKMRLGYNINIKLDF